MHKRDLIAVGTWIGIGLALWIIAWIIASAIPVFSNLLSLIVRLTPFCNINRTDQLRLHCSQVGLPMA